MNVVGKVGSLISQGVYSVATPFHPFGGAVDVIVVQQQDGTFRSTPWYVQFGKFQGVLKGVEKIVRISVNGVEADFHMYLDNSGEAYFVKEVNSGECSDVKGDLKEGDGLEGAKKEVTNDEKGNLGGLERTASDSGRLYYEFEDDQLSLENSIELSEFESSRYDNLDVEDHYVESNNLNSEVVLISVDGHMLKAPISSMERDIDDDVELSTPKFHLGPGQEADFFEDTADFTPSDDAWTTNYLSVLATSPVVESKESCCAKTAVEASEIEDCAGNKEHPSQVEERESGAETNLEDGSINEDILATSPVVESKESCCEKTAVEASKPQPEDCAGNEEHTSQIEERESGEETNPEDGSINIRKEDIFKSCLDIPALANHDRDSPLEIIENASLGLANEGGGDADDGVLGHNDDLALSSSSLPLNKQAELDTTELIGENVVTGDINSDNTSPPKATDNTEVEENVDDSLAVEQCILQRPEDISELPSTPSGRRWRLWPIPFRRVKVLEHTSSTSTIDEGFVDSLSGSQNQLVETTPTSTSGNENKQFLRINVPTTEQIASLNLKEGQNIVTFSFCTRVLGMQQVDAHIYLWKWNARIVISDVDGTITKSDVLGQFMPLFGRDWTQSGVARLFCAIKENGYQLLFLSARAIVQAYITRSFLNNIKQDGKALPTGPVVISPNGLFPSLYREVIRRAPQEFKIACLEDIKALFPPDYNPFYAGFGNRDTDELSYRKIGIPKGKIFIINPKGEVAISQHRIDVKSYTSLHTLVNDMFPPTSMVEQEDFNSWNFWRMPLPDLD